MGADYAKFGLNDQLQSKDSLAVKSDYTTAASFDSQYEGLSAIQIPDTFKIAKRGTLTETTFGTEIGGVSTVGTHNLGYIPIVFAYALIYSAADSPNALVTLPNFSIGDEAPSAGIISSSREVIAGSTTVAFAHNIYPVNGTLSAGTTDYIYYLMRETGGK